MAFKHNLPIPAIVLALLATAIAALVFFHSPPDEDLIRQAVDKYVSTLGPVRQMEIHGNVADIVTESNHLIYAEFENQHGTWTFARNLAEEYSRAMKDTEVQRSVLQHLGEKVSQRLQSSVTFKEGIDFQFELLRDRELDKLIGFCVINFAYPKIGDQQKRGQYKENFEWKDGKWQSWGPGALFDKVGQ